MTLSTRMYRTADYSTWSVG